MSWGSAFTSAWNKASNFVQQKVATPLTNAYHTVEKFISDQSKKVVDFAKQTPVGKLVTKAVESVKQNPQFQKTVAVAQQKWQQAKQSKDALGKKPKGIFNKIKNKFSKDKKVKKPVQNCPSTKPSARNSPTISTDLTLKSGDKLAMARNLMKDLGLTEAQAAGIVGNMAAESGVENARPQGSRSGTKAPLKVDGKTGYGLVQWTFKARQQKLADFAKSKGADLSKPLSMDIEYQFFLKEFKSDYGQVLSQLKKANDVKEASTIFMQEYERPAGLGTEAKIKERFDKSKPIYDELINGKSTDNPKLSQLHPSVQKRAEVFLSKAKAAGFDLRITQGYRSIEEQDNLYAQGRTKPGSKVTNAKGGESFHNYGLAFDVVDAKKGYDIDWNAIGKIGREAGLEWGGDWTGFKDKPHFQYTGGLSLSQVQKGSRPKE